MLSMKEAQRQAEIIISTRPNTWVGFHNVGGLSALVAKLAVSEGTYRQQLAADLEARMQEHYVSCSRAMVHTNDADQAIV